MGRQKSEMSLEILSVLCNNVQCRKVLSVCAQSGDDVRLVLIFIATDNHQAIIYGGGIGRKEKRDNRRRKKLEL